MRRHPSIPKGLSFPEIREIVKTLPPGTYCFTSDANWARGRLIREIPELEVGKPQFESEEEERMERGGQTLGDSLFGSGALRVAGLYVKGGEHETVRYDS